MQSNIEIVKKKNYSPDHRKGEIHGATPPPIIHLHNYTTLHDYHIIITTHNNNVTIVHLNNLNYNIISFACIK